MSYQVAPRSAVSPGCRSEAAMNSGVRKEHRGAPGRIRNSRLRPSPDSLEFRSDGRLRPLRILHLYGAGAQQPRLLLLDPPEFPLRPFHDAVREADLAPFLDVALLPPASTRNRAAR